MLIHREDEEEPIEVEPDQVEIQDEDPYLTQEEVDSVVSKRVSRAERTTRSDLKENEEFIRDALQNTMGLELDEEGNPKGSTNKDELKQLRQRISELEPKAKKAEELEQKIEEARETERKNKLLQSAKGVKDDLQDAFLRVAKDRFKYDEEEGRHVAVNENGEVIFNGGDPAGADAIVEEMQENRPSFFKDKSASSGTSDEPTSSTTGGKKNWTAEEHASADPSSMDEETYKDWLTAPDEGRVKG